MNSSSQRSTTAEGTAICRALGAMEAPHLRNPDHLAHHFVTRPAWRAGLLPGLRVLVRRKIEQRLPGALVLHHVRTRVLDRLLLGAVEAGASQVVLLGAGADSRAHRFRRELEGVTYFEVDHPSTSAWKQSRVRKMLGRLASPVRYVPVDFDRQPVPEALAGAGFDANRPTFFLWEGVTMYLRAESVNATLAFVARWAAGSSVAFDYLHAEALAHPDRYESSLLHMRYVEALGEPFTLGLPADRAELAGTLAARGLRLTRSWHTPEIRSVYPGQGRLPDFFSLAQAEVPDRARYRAPDEQPGHTA